MSIPITSLVVKLASLARHAEELLEGSGHSLDVEAIRGLVSDPEVQEAFSYLDGLALLPVKRT